MVPSKPLRQHRSSVHRSNPNSWVARLFFFSIIIVLFAPSIGRAQGVAPIVSETREKLRKTLDDVDPPLPARSKNPVPPKLGANTDVQSAGCRRKAIQNDRIYRIDSFAALDANGLAKLVAESPGAMKRIDSYRFNQKLVNVTAYTSTIGILIAATATVLSQQFGNPQVGEAYRLGALIGGASLTGASLATGVIANLRNEAHLREAAKIYSQQFPERQIRLEFKAGFNLF